MSELKKPWEYEWERGESPDGHGEIQCVPGGRVWIGAVDHDAAFDTGEERFAVRNLEAGVTALVLAAPDLYRALAHAVERAVLRCPDLLDKSKPEGVGILLSGEAFEAAKAALRKARGE